METVAYVPRETVPINIGAIATTTPPANASPGAPLVIRIQATADCFVQVANPASPINPQAYGMPLTAEIPEYLRVPDGEVVAVQGSAAGTLYVTRMTER